MKEKSLYQRFLEWQKELESIVGLNKPKSLLLILPTWLGCIISKKTSK